MEEAAALTSSDDIERLTASIRQTQAALQGTVAEIQERLSPRYLRQQARAVTMERITHMMNRAGDNVRNHPVPFALAGVGIATAVLLGLKRSRQRRADRSYMTDEYDSRTPYEEEASTLGITGEATERAGRAASRVRNGWDRILQENPMVLGLAALAVGALVGAAFPATGLEDEYFGDTRERVFESARSMAERKAQSFASGY